MSGELRPQCDSSSRPASKPKLHGTCCRFQLSCHVSLGASFIRCDVARCDFAKRRGAVADADTDTGTDTGYKVVLCYDMRAARDVMSSFTVRLQWVYGTRRIRSQSMCRRPVVITVMTQHDILSLPAHPLIWSARGNMDA